MHCNITSGEWMRECINAYMKEYEFKVIKLVSVQLYKDYKPSFSYSHSVNAKDNKHVADERRRLICFTFT
uniref:Uncharacterized protein n=1 Tax=Glossina palpalis gambiensis TaxID=67801 RepID=A0A1B0AZE9_9MUSC